METVPNWIRNNARVRVRPGPRSIDQPWEWTPDRTGTIVHLSKDRAVCDIYWDTEGYSGRIQTAKVAKFCELETKVVVQEEEVIKSVPTIEYAKVANLISDLNLIRSEMDRVSANGNIVTLPSGSMLITYAVGKYLTAEQATHLCKQIVEAVKASMQIAYDKAKADLETEMKAAMQLKPGEVADGQKAST